MTIFRMSTAGFSFHKDPSAANWPTDGVVLVNSDRAVTHRPVSQGPGNDIGITRSVPASHGDPLRSGGKKTNTKYS